MHTITSRLPLFSSFNQSSSLIHDTCKRNPSLNSSQLSPKCRCSCCCCCYAANVSNYDRLGPVNPRFLHKGLTQLTLIRSSTLIFHGRIKQSHDNTSGFSCFDNFDDSYCFKKLRAFETKDQFESNRIDDYFNDGEVILSLKTNEVGLEHNDIKKMVKTDLNNSRILVHKDQIFKDNIGKQEEEHNLENKQLKEDEMFMREALLEAKKAADVLEVPVGAVLVKDGKIIARGYNMVEELQDSTAHAEMICIRKASISANSWRLLDTTLYVTLEPCPMCAGAILQARIHTVVWGAPNKLLGADGSWIRLFCNEDGESGSMPPAPAHPFHPNMAVRRGVMAAECGEVMQNFFKLRRKKKT